ncbi:MAG: AMP-binding protein [Candidatus Bathyarchaeia archaeon]
MNVESVAIQGYWVNNWIAQHAKINPNHVALIDEKSERRFTYRVFSERVDRISAFFKKELKLEKGDRVGMISWNRIEMLDVLFATAKIGGIFTPINTRYTSREIEEQITLFKPKVLIYEEEFTERVRELKKVKSRWLVHLGKSHIKDSIDFENLVNYEERLDRPTPVNLEDPFMILQTGGTTGTPKGAIIPYRMIFWNAMITIRDLIVPGEVTVTCVPLFHIGGYTYTLPLLFWQGTNILMYRWNPEKLLELIEKEKVTFQFLVPAQLKMLVESPKFKTSDLTSVRWFTTGGAALTKDIVDAFLKKGVLVKQGYGLTEAGPGVFALDPKDAIHKIGSIGKPNLLIDVKVVNDKGEEVPPNTPGELLIRAPSLFGGYWNNPEESLKALEGGWLHTGDIVKYDEEGFFYIVGRKKNVIRSGSESIYPEEIERTLGSHPKIREAVVFGIPDEKWGEVPKALIVLKTGEKLSTKEVIKYCEDKMAKYKIPKVIEFVDSIPKTPAGKILREKLIEKYG